MQELTEIKQQLEGVEKHLESLFASPKACQVLEASGLFLDEDWNGLHRLSGAIRQLDLVGDVLHPVENLRAMRKTMEGPFPVVDRLQEQLEAGGKIAQQDGQWWLFNAGGEGVASGETLRRLLVNLVFAVC